MCCNDSTVIRPSENIVGSEELSYHKSQLQELLVFIGKCNSYQYVLNNLKYEPSEIYLLNITNLSTFGIDSQFVMAEFKYAKSGDCLETIDFNSLKSLLT